MTKVKTEETAGVLSAQSLEDTPGKRSNPVQPSVFSDTVYTSRTLILPDGRAVLVAKGQVTATDDALLGYLTQHADFQPLAE